jgi:hypothetical protein
MKFAVLHRFGVDEFYDGFALQAVAFVRFDIALGFLLAKPLGDREAMQQEVSLVIADMGNAGGQPAAINIALINLQFAG